MLITNHYFKTRKCISVGRIFILLFIGFLIYSPFEGKSQTFSEIAVGQVKGQELGYSSWCDVNGDGFLDIFITGMNLSQQGDFKNALIYLNDQQGAFLESGINNIPRVIYGSHDWGDFNNDGLPDLVLSGTISGFPEDAITRIYIQQEKRFQPLALELPGLMNSQVKWFDYNNDGWQDLFLMGINQANEFIMKVYANQEGVSLMDSQMVFPVAPGQRTNLGRTGVLIQDFDKDGDVDIIVGHNSSKGFSVDAYENKEANYLKKDVELPQLSNASFATADFDRDGFLDVVVNGIQEKETSYTYDAPSHFVVLKGNADFSFSVLKEFNNQGSYWGAVCAGDLNADGLPDIIINGSGNGRAQTSFFINQNGQDFKLNEIPEVQGTLLGDAQLGDLDNDGKLDLLVTGSIDGSATTAQARIYKNTTRATNHRPSVPENLKAEYKSGKIFFSWDSAHDLETSQNSISYNIRIGTVPNGMDVQSCMSLDKGSRIIEDHGNAGLATSFALNVPEGTYYWQVQSIDAAYYESELSEVNTFCFKPAPNVNYKPRYCYQEPVKISAEGNFIQWFSDLELNELIKEGPNLELIADKDSIFYVTQTVDGCSSEATKVNFTVNEKPDISLSVDGKAVEGFSILLPQCEENEVFEVSAKSNLGIVKWVDNDKETIAIHKEGTYKLYYSDDNGCNSQKEVFITFQPLYKTFIPNVITPNMDNFNEVFYIDLPSTVEFSVSIFNRYGKRVFFSPSYKNDFSGEDLNPGTYFYQVKSSLCREWNGTLTIIK